MHSHSSEEGLRHEVAGPFAGSLSLRWSQQGTFPKLTRYADAVVGSAVTVAEWLANL